MTVQSSLLHTRPVGAVFGRLRRPIGRDARIDSFMSHLRTLLSGDTELHAMMDVDSPRVRPRVDVHVRIERRQAQITPPAPNPVTADSSHIQW